MVLVIIAVFIIGFLIGSLTTLPQNGGRTLPAFCPLIETAPKYSEDVDYFAECLELVKDSDIFQKQLWRKEWQKKTPN